jgi:hypothetical protein
MTEGTNTKQIIIWLGVASFIVLAILVIMEIYSYYFAGAGSAKTADLARVTDWHLPAGTAREGFCDCTAREGFDVLDVKDEVKQFPDIIDYIEKVEEPQFYNRSRVIGCYDNNDLIGSSHPGETCKSWYPRVTDIFFKPKTPADVPTATQNTGNANNYFNVEGQSYSFAELCPETTNQKDPIACLHDRAQAFDLMSTKIANINDSIQNKQDKTISNLSDDVSYHIIDGNRVYNQNHVRDFIGYERSLGLGSAIHGGNAGDQLDDLGLYSRKKRVNYLAGTKNAN